MRARWSRSLVREHRDSIPEGAGPAGQPSHIFHRRCACTPAQRDATTDQLVAVRGPREKKGAPQSIARPSVFLGDVLA
jgi:hypothetical protein